ncbi:MAG: coniferyl aldehyde dehydrogenase [Xanthomonadaceae bacterium]|jgi:coniferyl-aldehyde dehydrogenase|nr:coniferyl aldehyde dehydrogenase [Xanthomonadaceae bacterium]
MNRLVVTSDTDLAVTLARLRTAWQANHPSLTQRRDDLMRLRTVFKERMPQMVQAISADFGHRSPYESLLADGMTVLNGIDYLRKHLRAWMKPRRIRIGWRLWPARAELRPQPVGVVGVISPWNYPVNLALMPLATAIAAGNHVYLKPSEHTPRTTQFLADLLAEVFPSDRVAVAVGDARVAGEFSELPFDHLFFTGSTAVGRKVMAAAAANLTPVTLELGGKSPAIVCDDYPIARVAARLATGKWFNAGQTCIAPDYVLVGPARRDALIDAFHEQIRARYGPSANHADYTRIITPDHYARLQAYVDDARARGWDVLTLAEGDPAQCVFPPTLILDPENDARVMQEEIFGPVLPIVTIDSLDDAIAYIRRRERPLALYPFSASRATVNRILQAVLPGGVTVNDTLLHFAVDALPFGGVGASGIGAYHGKAGFDTFSKMLPIVWQARHANSDLLKPPYAGIAKLIRFLVR